MVFLLDASDDISEDDFIREVIGTARALVSQWHGRVGYNLIHIGVITYSDRQHVSNYYINLSNYLFVKNVL